METSVLSPLLRLRNTGFLLRVLNPTRVPSRQPSAVLRYITHNTETEITDIRIGLFLVVRLDFTHIFHWLFTLLPQAGRFEHEAAFSVVTRVSQIGNNSKQRNGFHFTMELPLEG